MEEKRTFSVQHPGDVEVFLGNVEGEVEIVEGVVLAEHGVVEEVRPVSVDQGTERQTILGGKTTRIKTSPGLKY